MTANRGRPSLHLLAVFVLGCLLCSSSLPAFADPYPAQLPGTGQTGCYDEDGNTIACANTGLDGDIQAGIPLPNPRLTDNNDGTLTDNLTGLIWLKNPSSFIYWLYGPTNDNGVTWLKALALANQLSSGSCCGLNDGSKAGDWRLPNINELKSLLDYTVSLPTLSPYIFSYLCPGFVFCDPGNYWSSTPALTNATGQRWVVALGDGSTTSDDGYYSTQWVWPVRDGSGKRSIHLPKTGVTSSFGDRDDGALQKGVAWPNNRFTKNGNGTVTDNLTGLIWLKDAGCFAGPYVDGYKIGMIWTDAIAAANRLANKDCGLSDGSKAGDWRLPNVNELQSLIDYSQVYPALPMDQPFTDVWWDNYWSSTSYAGQPQAQWIVSLGGGKASWDYKYTTLDHHHFVWPVRGGQIGASGPVIVSFSPKEGGYGTSVTIKGINFTGATAVTFGGKAAESFTVDSATQITAKVSTAPVS